MTLYLDELETLIQVAVKAMHPAWVVRVEPLDDPNEVAVTVCLPDANPVPWYTVYLPREARRNHQVLDAHIEDLVNALTNHMEKMTRGAQHAPGPDSSTASSCHKA